MKNISFQSISIKNFLSIGEQPFNITFNKGVNLITGENLDVPDTKNGIGKSAIPCAFNFAIFGDALRNIKKDQMVNNITKGTTEVILKFNCDSPKGNNNFIIKRTLNPSSLQVLKDGRDKTRDSIPNTTKYILEVLGANQAIFENCIILRANNTIPFLAKGKVDKKKFIESLFNLDVITKMFKLVKDDINLVKRDIEVETKIKNQFEDSKLNYNNKIINERKEVERKEKQYKEDIEFFNNKILELAAESDKNINFDNEIEQCKKEIKKANAVLTKLSGDIQLENHKISEAISLKKDIKNLGAVCPTCQRPFDKEDIEHKEKEEDRLNAIISESKNKLSKLNALKIKASKLINENDNKLDSIYSKQKDHSLISTKVQSYKDKILMTENLIKSLTENNISFIEDIIKNLDNDIEDKTKILNDYNSKLKNFEIARYILSEDGIRTYIIKKLLDLLNFRIKYYLVKQNSQYNLTFDSYFDEEITNKKGLPVSYGNLSGAESKMLDLACLWAFKDILRLQGSLSFNLSFYDEILDSSLDSKNSEIVCSILNEFAQNEGQSIYLISHKNDISKMATGEIIYLQKKNGITSKKDDK